MTARLDLTGKTFGQLLVLECVGQYKPNKEYKYRCLCTCGKTTVTMQSSLNKGKTKSCGCLRVETMKRLFSLPSGEHAFNQMYYKYEVGARKRKLDFSLTKDQFRKLTQEDCHYCGVPPRQKIQPYKTTGSYIYNGIDRKDNSIGYVLVNCLPCCYQCNLSKSNYEYDFFIEWVKRISKNLKGKGLIK